jgi:hypothetical protein
MAKKENGHEINRPCPHLFLFGSSRVADSGRILLDIGVKFPEVTGNHTSEFTSQQY